MYFVYLFILPLQLGIHQSVGNLASQEERDILNRDFKTVETVVFSR